MKKTFSILVALFIVLGSLYHYNHTEKKAIQKKLLPLENNKTDEYPEAPYSQNYFTDVHYSVEEYYDRTCPLHAAASYIHVDIAYPQIHLANNKKVQNIINHKLKELSLIDKLEGRTTYEITAKVAYFKKNFVSIVFKGDLMNCDDSHNYTWFDTLNFNTKNGNQYKLEELFNKTTLSTLHIKIKEYLKTQFPHTDIKDFSLDDPKLFKNFTFSDDAVTIYFSMYQIGAAAYGSMQVVIPFSDLSVKPADTNTTLKFMPI